MAVLASTKPDFLTVALHVLVSAVGLAAVVWESVQAERRRRAGLARVVAEVRAAGSSYCPEDPRHCPCGVLGGAYGLCRKCTSAEGN